MTMNEFANILKHSEWTLIEDHWALFQQSSSDSIGDICCACPMLTAAMGAGGDLPNEIVMDLMRLEGHIASSTDKTIEADRNVRTWIGEQLGISEGEVFHFSVQYDSRSHCDKDDHICHALDIATESRLFEVP